MDFQVFFDLYMRRDFDGESLSRDGVEFRYAAAALLVACSHADLDETDDEKEAISKLLSETFGVNEQTVERMFKFGYSSGEGTYLEELSSLINEQFDDRDKRFVLEKLWHVALIDGHLHEGEEEFIKQVAKTFNMSQEDINAARQAAQS